MDPNDFSDLKAKLKAGSPEAAGRLVVDYEPEIRREVGYLWRKNARLQRFFRQSDLCQSVVKRLYLQAYSGGIDVKDPAHLLRYVKRAVKNRILDAVRYWGGERGKVVPNDPAKPFDAPALQSSPSDDVERAELVSKFESRLDPEMRKVLALRRDQTPWEEIAQTIGNGTPEAIRIRFRREVRRVCREFDILAQPT